MQELQGEEGEWAYSTCGHMVHMYVLYGNCKRNRPSEDFTSLGSGSDYWDLVTKLLMCVLSGIGYWNHAIGQGSARARQSLPGLQWQ